VESKQAPPLKATWRRLSVLNEAMYSGVGILLLRPGFYTGAADAAA
jgi:hypothetical protein